MKTIAATKPHVRRGHTVTQQVLAELSVIRTTPPAQALAAAETHRESLVDALLESVSHSIDAPATLDASGRQLFRYALYLLAKWRQPRAHLLVVRWLSQPREGAFDIAGDTVTEEGGRFLALTAQGHVEPIMALAANGDANEYCRSEAVHAMALLAAWGEVPREVVLRHYRALLEGGLEREPSSVWNTLAESCASLEAVELFAELKRAFEANLIDPSVTDPDHWEQVAAAPRGQALAALANDHPPIADIAREIKWWWCFNRPSASPPQQWQ